jgi:glutaredoxin 3
MVQVDIYTTRYCPYCIAAKQLLSEKKVAFTEIDVGRDQALRAAMVDRAQGRTTVPQIFIGSTHVGGCDDLYALEDAGERDALRTDRDTPEQSASERPSA